MAGAYLRRFSGGIVPVHPEELDFDNADAHHIWYCSMCSSRIGSNPGDTHSTVRRPSADDRAAGVIGTWVHRQCLDRFIARGRTQPRWRWQRDPDDARYAILVPYNPPAAAAAAPRPGESAAAAVGRVVGLFLAIPDRAPEPMMLPPAVFGDSMATPEDVQQSHAAKETIRAAAQAAIAAGEVLDRCNPLTLPLRPRDSMGLLHWSFRRRDHRATSDALLAWLLEQKDDVEGEPINGGVTQYDIDAALQHNDRMRKELTSLVVARMNQCYISTAGYRLITPKILDAPPGCGGQAVHFDAYDPAHSDRCLSFVMHLSEGEGIHSTALPSYPASLLTLPNVEHAQQMQVSAQQHLMDAESMCETEVLIGDNTLFRQSRPHRGTSNRTRDRSVHRTVFFCMMVPPESPEEGDAQADEYQLFRWQYMDMAFGADSAQHARALAVDGDQDPILPGRISSAFARHTLLLVLCKYGEWNRYEQTRHRGASAPWSVEDAAALLERTLALQEEIDQEEEDEEYRMSEKDRREIRKLEKEQIERERTHRY